LIQRGQRFDAHLSPLQAGLTSKSLTLPQWFCFHFVCCLLAELCSASVARVWRSRNLITIYYY